MNKKIKIIELLNKIENEEKVPKRIKWGTVNYILKQDSIDGHLYYKKEQGCASLVAELKTMSDLKSEIEILEDNTEDKGYELLKTIKNENDFDGFEEFGEKLGKIYLDILKGFKKAFENELRKEKE